MRRVLSAEHRMPLRGRQPERAAEFGHGAHERAGGESAELEDGPLRERRQGGEHRRVRRGLHRHRLEQRGGPRQTEFFRHERAGIEDRVDAEEIRVRAGGEKIVGGVTHARQDVSAQDGDRAVGAVVESAEETGRSAEFGDVGPHRVEAEALALDLGAVVGAGGERHPVPASLQLASDGEERMHIPERTEGGEDDVPGAGHAGGCGGADARARPRVEGRGAGCGVVAADVSQLGARRDFLLREKRTAV